jgi:hypothetical protein
MRTILSVCYALVILFLILLFSGCGGGPPDSISISSEFTAEQQEVIRSAVDGWCDAVGWCPEETLDSDRGRISLVDDLPEADYACDGCMTYAANDGDNIRVVRNPVVLDDLSSFWITIAHELGHYCTGHTGTGLMAAVHSFNEVPSIDQVANNAWHKGCD